MQSLCMLAAQQHICIEQMVLVFHSHVNDKLQFWKPSMETSKVNVLTIYFFLPVVYMCDCGRPVAEDPGLDVHGSCFGVSYGHIYYPLQAFTFITCHRRKTNTRNELRNKKKNLGSRLEHDQPVFKVWHTLIIHATAGFKESRCQSFTHKWHRGLRGAIKCTL